MTAAEAEKRLADLLDLAQREPVVIQHQNGDDVAVLVSSKEYHRLRALNASEFSLFCDRIGKQAAARGLTEDKLATLLADRD